MAICFLKSTAEGDSRNCYNAHELLELGVAKFSLNFM